jgi:hypothetical protein
MKLAFTFLLCVIVYLSNALEIYEPANGNIMFSFWLDTESQATSASGGDSPVAFIQRTGMKPAAFAFSQQIPLIISPYDGSQMTSNLSMVQVTNTGKQLRVILVMFLRSVHFLDAIFFITLYPLQGFSAISDRDIDIIVQQLSQLTNPINGSSRRVVLRFAPESM